MRHDEYFCDVTLACEDKQNIEAHKDILAASSPVFRELLKDTKNSHPLLYVRGIKVKCQCNHGLRGVNIYQEDLNNFLAITEKLELKGLTGSGNEELDNESPQFEPEQVIFLGVLSPYFITYSKCCFKESSKIIRSFEPDQRPIISRYNISILFFQNGIEARLNNYQ